MTDAEYVYSYYFKLFVLYFLYCLAESIAEGKNISTSNDGRDIYRLNWAIGLEEQPKRSTDTVYQKSYEYDERDRLTHAVDNFQLNSVYKYDESGNRSHKYNYFNEEETLYANRYYSTSLNSFNKVYDGQSIKHIFLNNERLVTKTALNKINGTERAYSDYEITHTYYYHTDHLGSATLITDYRGKEYQRIEYTPYGESWIELTKNTGENYLPYRFTGKELDEETGFYYYGQRYFDPKYSIWHTSDPAIYDYMSQSKEGEGGIYNITNLNIYHYAGNNPVKYTDPDGRVDASVFFDFANNWFNLAGNVALMDSPALGPADVVALAMLAIAGGAVVIGGVVELYNLIAQTNEKADTKGVAVSATDTKKNDSTIIYRFGNGNGTNLTPLMDKDDTGLSYTLVKPEGVPYTMTTIEAVNATGVLTATQDSSTHVSVNPTDPSKMKEWQMSRENANINPHLYTKILQSISVSSKE